MLKFGVEPGYVAIVSERYDELALNEGAVRVLYAEATPDVIYTFKSVARRDRFEQEVKNFKRTGRMQSSIWPNDPQYKKQRAWYRFLDSLTKRESDAYYGIRMDAEAQKTLQPKLHKLNRILR